MKMGFQMTILWHHVVFLFVFVILVFVKTQNHNLIKENENEFDVSSLEFLFSFKDVYLILDRRMDIISVFKVDVIKKINIFKCFLCVLFLIFISMKSFEIDTQTSTCASYEPHFISNFIWKWWKKLRCYYLCWLISILIMIMTFDRYKVLFYLKKKRVDYCNNMKNNYEQRMKENLKHRYSIYKKISINCVICEHACIQRKMLINLFSCSYRKET